ncbi:MAG: hypothetical protein JW759_08695 [Candidatus Coatesbacteria bacterium]|nr:hypothetical protein [Candidatus Coatesbacteria bacterium]
MVTTRRKESEAERRESPLERLAKSRPEYVPLCDNPLNVVDYADDKFGLCYKLGPVYHYLRQPNTPTPLTVAIYGSSGTGKTSAMRCLHGMIDTWNKEGEPSAGQQKIKLRPVWFYPWKHHTQEDVWRGLTAEVVFGSLDMENAAPRRIAAAMRKFGRFLGPSFLHTLSASKDTFKAKAGVGAKAHAEAEYNLADLKDRILTECRDVALPEKEFLSEFQPGLRSWVHKTIVERNERMVVFIDDLDRCVPAVALDVLETLKLHLNVEGMVLVVSVDRAVIDRLVARHYKDLGLSEGASARYLDEIFQVEVYLNPTGTEVEAFVQSLFRQGEFGIQDVKENERNILCKVILKLARRNPRETKHLLSSALMLSLGERIAADARGETKTRFSTAQAIQCYLVHKIMFSQGLAGLLSDRRTLEFFYEWSKTARASKNVERLYKEAVGDRERDDTAFRTHSGLGSVKNPLRTLLDEFHELRPETLMADENLRALMLIRCPKPDVSALVAASCLDQDVRTDANLESIITLLGRCDADSAAHLLGRFPPDVGANVLSSVHRYTAADLLSRIEPERAAEVLHALMCVDFGKAAEVLSLVAPNRGPELFKALKAIDPERAEWVRSGQDNES